jgi:hypothetical protein
MKRSEGGQLTLRIVRSLSELEELREIWTAWQSNPTSDIDNFFLIVRLRHYCLLKFREFWQAIRL